jgi:lipoprotein NlpD
LAGFSNAEHGNKGLDIGGKAGTPIKAAAAGEVVYAGNALRGYGNLVIIRHNDDFLSAYAHNRKLLVKERDTVVSGQTIAEMGNTDAPSVRLHFEIRFRGKSVDPKRYLK